MNLELFPTTRTYTIMLHELVLYIIYNILCCKTMWRKTLTLFLWFVNQHHFVINFCWIWLLSPTIFEFGLLIENNRRWIKHLWIKPVSIHFRWFGSSIVSFISELLNWSLYSRKLSRWWRSYFVLNLSTK